MYLAVGKAYFFQPKEVILTKLAETIKAAEEDMKSAAQNKEYIAKGIHSTEQEMRELLQSAPGLAARIVPQEG
jgi:chaperonin cofactor prefoldin